VKKPPELKKKIKEQKQKTRKNSFSPFPPSSFLASRWPFAILAKN